GEVCDRGRCVDGCRDSGDCNRTSCACDGGPCACAGDTPEARASCEVGTCDPTVCEDNSFCRFGERCVRLDGADAGLGVCNSDYDPQRRPYCDACTLGGGDLPCGRGANFCLIDTTTLSNFCGADCSQGQACPRGYACSDVIVVSHLPTCGSTADCRKPSASA